MLPRCLPLFALAASLAFTSRAGAQPPVRPVPPPKPTLRVFNMGPDSVVVELRAGPSLDCALNPVVSARTIPPTRAWTVKAFEPLCYRYQRPTGPWSSWVRRVIAKTAVVADSV